MDKTDRFSVIFFTVVLLLIGCTIKSDIIIDRSYLPRFAVLSVLLLASIIFFFRRIHVPRKSLFLFSLFALYLWSFFSSLWSLSAAEALMQSQLLFSGVVVWLLVTHFQIVFEKTEAIFIRLLMALLLFTFSLAFYRMWSIPFYDPYLIKSISANNNLYAGFLLLSMPFVLTGYLILKKGWKIAAICTGVLTLFFIILLQSRAVYLGLFLSVTIFFLILITRYRSFIKMRHIRDGAISLIVLAGLLILFYNSLDQTRKAYFLSKVMIWSYIGTYDNPKEEKARRLLELKKASPGEIAPFDHSADYYENANLRMIFWKKSLCLFNAHPIAGVGAGNWRLNIPSCPEPPNPDHTRLNYTYSQPHNEAISIVTELGLIGIALAFLVFILPLFRAFIGIRKRNPAPSFSLALYSAFLAGFFVFSMFDFPLKRVEHNILFFSAMAFLLVKIPEGEPRFRWLTEIPPSAVKGIVVASLVFSLLITFFRIKGEYYSLKMFMNERKDDERVIEYCRQACNPFYDITPNTLPVDWFQGVAHYRKGQITEAVVCFERALETTPYEVRVLNDYGAALFAAGQTDNAKEALRTSIRIDPHFDDSRFNLAAIHYFTGRPDSALYYIRPCRDSEKKREFLEELR